MEKHRIAVALMILLVVPLHAAFAAWEDIPEEPEVHFKAFVPQYAQIQRDFSINMKVFDDRSSYHRSAPNVGNLYDADVTITIYPSWDGSYIIEELRGTTAKNGHYSGVEFVTSHDYESHALYNMTITAQYGESEDVQEFQFWTIQDRY